MGVVVKVRDCGDRALLVEADHVDTVLGLYSALANPVPKGVIELVPAARTLLVHFDPKLIDAATLTRLVLKTEPVPSTTTGGDLVTIPVCYDGEDLPEVGRRTGLGQDGVIAAHTDAEYVVAFGGFAPGFGYLTGLDPRLHLPRRDTPRTRVPAGAVAIAGEFAGIYPRPSPGGWQILGHTKVTLWDPDRCPPALLRPGVRVRFRQMADQPASPTKPRSPARSASEPAALPAIEVCWPGPLTTVQDFGRPGMAALGVSPSGAADRRSAALANRLVGNPEDAACLETTLGGLALLFHRSARVAVTGAPCPISLDGRGEAMNAPFTVNAGQRLVLDAPSTGLRSYLSVRGGIGIPPTLRSRSTDLLSGLGPAALVAGNLLPVGGAHCGPLPAIDVAPVADPPDGELTVRVVPGPRDDWFYDHALRTLGSAGYMVTSESNRIGIRLAGRPLSRAHDGELPSEGIVAGAVQVPPSGQPVVFLADHPITGGYPVIAVVLSEDLAILAQARPGQLISFRMTRHRVLKNG